MIPPVTKEIVNVFSGILVGRKWQLKIDDPADNWRKATESDCIFSCLSNGFLVRLEPIMKWVDFSNSVTRRPTSKVMAQHIKHRNCEIVEFSSEREEWCVIGKGYYLSDVELFRNYHWLHEDGTSQPFGVQIEVE
jgi:hypothetical protein